MPGREASIILTERRCVLDRQRDSDDMFSGSLRKGRAGSQSWMSHGAESVKRPYLRVGLSA